MISFLKNYDVCVVPSRKEGYHTLPAQCAAAGIACICTDECVSDELVKKYSTGIVIKKNSVNALYHAMITCMVDKESLFLFKKNTENVREGLRMEKIAEYFWNIVNNCSNSHFSNIECPW